MANIKAVNIVAKVPWDWSSQLLPEEAQMFISWFWNPMVGITIERKQGNPMARGTEIKISGEEAMSVVGLRLIVSALRRVGKVEHALYRDVENDTEWFHL